jgi:hypothetical protein
MHVRRYSAKGTCGAAISGSRSLRIEGSGVLTTILDCEKTGRHFTIADGFKLFLSDIQLVNGLAEGHGGSIHAKNTSKIILTDVVISDSEAEAGGVVYAEEGTQVSVTGTSVLKDSHAAQGGCLYIQQGCSVYLSGYAELRNCRAREDSGGVHAVSSSVQFADMAKATGCRATGSGGVVTMVGDQAAVTVGGQVEFSSNAAGSLVSHVGFASRVCFSPIMFRCPSLQLLGLMLGLEHICLCMVKLCTDSDLPAQAKTVDASM